jgi:DNA-binding XRE family transcriptional regulator
MSEIQPIYKELGTILMLWRHENNVTQEETGNFLDLTRASVANIEAGRQRIMLHTLIDLATLMSMEPADLLYKAMERVRKEHRNA